AEVIIEDATGGMRIDLLTGEKREWGDWQAGESQAALSSAADGCTVDACKRNCRWSIVGWEYIKKKAARVVAWTVLAPFTGGGSIAGVVWEVGSTAKKLYDCDLNCRANPQEHCCTADQVRWSGAGLFGGVTNSCYREKCNATTGTWVPDGFKTCVAFGERCVAGIGGPGCTPCEERGLAQQVSVQTVSARPTAVEAVDACAGAAAAKPRCRDLALLIAKDPNAIYGPAGDLLPGDRVTYTITYENEGEGRAYGVYIVNALPEVFDASTISFTHGSGVYLPDSRELFWLVGELGPKGAADSEGVITYTVALTGGLASGTVVANQAVVYFPSVPEETPTNSWVNVVSPLAAIPQHLTTDYMTPLPLILSGWEASGLPLTYEIVEPPHGGLLTGTLPTLTYTPIENFTGADGFSFQVSNGVTTSRPAQVYLTVTPAGDTTPPQVLWTNPATDATDVATSTTPLFTDTLGLVYAPVILIGVSEPLSATTVSTTTVTLTRSGSESIPISVYFDGNADQIILLPRAAMAPGYYTVAVTAGVTDLAGNPVQAYSWSFSTEGAAPPYHYIYLPLILRAQ
ncbi:MAG: Ig-like domain-containing protein, partial [Anaerolineae bacterium]|nr:Ig-like domain-containing protein [Anaerolineae bacterium]